MDLSARRLAAASALAAASVASATPAGAAVDPFPILSVYSTHVAVRGDYEASNFTCHVEAGRRLADCAASANMRDNPAELTALAAWLEASPPCMVPDLPAGSLVSRTVWRRLGQPLEGAAHYTMPDWAARSQAGVWASNPVAGSAVVRCAITVEGRTADCRVFREAPAGHGVGAAALKVAPHLRFRPETRDCVATGEGMINIPINITSGR